jgi:hypothetical protein
VPSTPADVRHTPSDQSSCHDFCGDCWLQSQGQMAVRPEQRMAVRTCTANVLPDPAAVVLVCPKVACCALSLGCCCRLCSRLSLTCLHNTRLYITSTPPV